MLPSYTIIKLLTNYYKISLLVQLTILVAFNFLRQIIKQIFPHI